MVALTAEDPDTGKVNTRRGVDMRKIQQAKTIKRAIPGPSTETTRPGSKKKSEEEEFMGRNVSMG